MLGLASFYANRALSF